MPSLTLQYNIDSIATCSPDGQQLVLGCSNFIGPRWTGALAVVDTAGDSPRMLQMAELRTGVPAVALLSVTDEFTGRRVVAAGGDNGSVDLWYLSSSNGSPAAAAAAGGKGGSSTPSLLQHAQGKALHDGEVKALAPAPSSAQLASGSGDGTLRLWDCSQLLACTGTLGVSGSAPINAVTWTPGEGATLASAGSDGRLCLWDTRQLSSMPAAAAPVGAPALSLAALAAPGAAQPLLLVGDQLGRLSVFDPRSLSQPLQQRQLHADAVHALATSSTSGQAASGSDDGSIMLLNSTSLEASRQLVPARQDGEVPLYVRALAWSGGAAQQQLWQGGWDQAIATVPL